jgi:hypothetical protein
MAKSVSLSNGREWKSKIAAKAHFKEMLSRYRNGQIIQEYNDHGDLAALLERFDTLVATLAPKNGAGIDRFERRLNRGDGWSSPGFWVIRANGSETDFSYVKAIDGKPKGQSQEFYDACHNAVSRDLLRFKQHQFDHFANEHGQIECDITGTLISYSEANLSHASPLFSAIVNEFRATKRWVENIPNSVLTVSADAQLSSHFANEADAEEFRLLHHRVAVLRIVSKSRPSGSLANSTVKRPLRIEF